MYKRTFKVTDRRPSDRVAMDNPAMEMEQSKNKSATRTKRDASPAKRSEKHQNKPGKDSGRPNGKTAANGKTSTKNGSTAPVNGLSNEPSERNGPKPGTGDEEPEMSPQKMQLRTTVPQSMTPKDLQSGPHSPRPRGSSRQKSPAATPRKGCECCRLYFFLTIFQLLAGAGIIVLCVFISKIFTDTRSRDVPYWSGIPLVIAAFVGMYSCIFSRNKFESAWHFGVRIFFWMLTFFCCIACVVAATFAGLHGTSIVDYVECLSLDSSCQCTKSFDSSARVFMYIDMTDCNLVFERLKVLLFISCGVNAFGALVCFLILVMMWKRNYQRFYTGLGYTYATYA
ncbi:SSPN [Branchiostoma lanceolatum]|uniref:SSPN protein n=2 Tax=Branchiostoma lanceolatum TaxID=7740 RepID=A0A8J9ZYG0_BRALA|nr:SSPN [Branchiostoma lanceolatum]